MKITVLLGGTSAEREVSLKSGKAVARALESRGHQVRLLDPADGPARLGTSASPATLGSAPAAEATAALVPMEPAELVSAPAIHECEVVFLALHGGEGENGTLQALLDLAGVAYTGSGMLASALAMDKRISKQIFRQNGIPTPDWIWLQEQDAARLTPGQVSQLGGFPLVVKPNDQGSSIGVSVATESAQLPDAIAFARKYSREVLVERFIPGLEITSPVLAGEAFPVVEIVPTHGMYDYECKYTRGMSNYLCPAPLDPAVTARVLQLAADAYRAMGCSGCARVDFRLSPQDEPYCLEVNTIPGMTETSLVPMSAQAAGVSFPELVERMCVEALESRRRRQALNA